MRALFSIVAFSSIVFSQAGRLEIPYWFASPEEHSTEKRGIGSPRKVHISFETLLRPDLVIEYYDTQSRVFNTASTSGKTPKNLYAIASKDGINCAVEVTPTDGGSHVDSNCVMPTDSENKAAREALRKITAALSHRTVAMDDFLSIRTGMSLDEVTNILGSGNELSRSDIAGYDTVMYGWKNRNGSNMNVMLQNGRVVSKAQAGLR